MRGKQGTVSPRSHSGARGDAAASLANLRGQRCAVNDLASNSGMNLLRAAIAPLAKGQPFFESVVTTGSHAQSLVSVANGENDVASIDCVTLAHMRLSMPEIVNEVRILAWTDESPGLPLVTAASTDDVVLSALRQALQEIAHDVRLAELREDLFIEGFEVLMRQPMIKLSDWNSQPLSLVILNFVDRMD